MTIVPEELKQRVIAKKATVNRYEQRIKQYRQNRVFSVDQKMVYQELSGASRQEKIVPDIEESRKFWGSMWDNKKKHNDRAEWLQELKEHIDHTRQEDLHINQTKVEMQCRKMPN